MNFATIVPFIVCVVGPAVSMKLTDRIPTVSLLALISFVAMPSIYVTTHTSPDDIERQVMTNHFQHACTFGDAYEFDTRTILEVLSTTIMVCFILRHATLSHAAVLTFLIMVRFCEILNRL
jgi:hypothetical protein